MKYNYFKIRALREQGRTWKQITEAVGCCENTVRRALADDIDGVRDKEKERQAKSRNARLCHAVENRDNGLNHKTAFNLGRLMSGPFHWQAREEKETG